MVSLFSDTDMKSMNIGENLIPPDLEIYIFGCGFTGNALLRRLRRAQRDAVCFLDNNPQAQGMTVSGLKVMNPADVVIDNPHACVVVAVSKPWAYDVLEQCTRLKLGNVMLLEDFFQRYGDLGEYGRIAAIPEVAEGLTVWDDEESLEAYKSLLRYRVGYRLPYLPPFKPDQYFPESIIGKRHLQSFVDCGAAGGDTLAEVQRRTGGDFVSYHAFEPDPGHYATLKTVADKDDRIVPHNLLVGNESAIRRFLGGSGGFSRIMTDGREEVRMETLDRVLEKERVTMIKMDIEGAELDALMGAEKLLRQQRPALVICIYHYPEHLWEIPVCINRLGLGYRLKLMRHGPTDHLESVCYAV